MLTAVHFPTNTDINVQPNLRKQFYDAAYAPSSKISGLDYVGTAQQGSEQQAARIREFVARYGLAEERVLEVGSGSGVLQDIIEDYTGLDIAETARRFYHKPFVASSATDIPFRDSSFDVIWTIWTLEHVPNPTRALNEMRRVLKPGGILYLAPAWNTPAWQSGGYEVRGWSELSLGEKLTKASIPVRSSYAFKALYRIPTRIIRSLALLDGRPTRLHYTLLQPSDKYRVPDADAVNSIDTYEAYLWFKSRGDECLNCEWLMLRPSYALIFRIRKEL